MLASMDLIEKSRKYQDYLHALEDERRKIQVFQRELPLCLELVSQAIENVKNQMESMVSEETASDGPVLEEFIPLKPSLSSSSGEESAHEVKKCASMEMSEKKADWLQSVQLWNQHPDPSPPPLPSVEPPCKPVPVNVRKIGGAFQPFEKEKHAPLPATSAGAASSSAGVSSGAAVTSSLACAASERKDKGKETQEKEKDKGKDKENEKEKEEQSQNNRKPRRCWSPELHRRFLNALQQLGGSHVATPKQIRELMKVDGLTNDEVKSHLQKYRLHTRRPSSAAQSSTNCSQPAPQFVVVGGIWVPPQEYAAAAAAASVVAPPSADITTRSSTIYTPVASLPSPHQHSNKRPLVNGPRCNGDAAVSLKSDSPSASSSSQTTTASPPF
ncbi:Myb family transcription factor-like [Rhynchospora pubera]|uniref:Myb family transcription factor-like n=1 Tax=Rhynchospora pubera TaxID=906938 RepID=A0AAV8DVU5_9POAL|nr:Myb family transcription factor-like [Rhynchospora pubera]